MYTVILYKRPSIEVGFFQPSSTTWSNPELFSYYQKIKDDGILISDIIETTEDNLIMKKVLTWKDFNTWLAYVEDFIRKFPNYSTEREQFHTDTNSQYSVNTFTLPENMITVVGNLNVTVNLTVVDNVAQATYTLI
jgi:hypothetical protein